MRGPLSPAFARRLDSASGPNLCALRDLLLFPGNLLTPEVRPVSRSPQRRAARWGGLLAIAAVGGFRPQAVGRSIGELRRPDLTRAAIQKALKLARGQQFVPSRVAARQQLPGDLRLDNERLYFFVGKK